MMSTPIGRLRLVGFLEGMSYLILLGIAMPLKYLADMPIAVRIVGSLHGGLFILFFAAVADVARRRYPNLPGLWWRSTVASLVPFGTFVLDAWLKRREPSS